MRRLLVLIALAAWLARMRHANACAACGCGDPTLTLLGTEKPFAGRLRLAFTTQYRQDGIGQPNVDALALSEWRLEAGMAWAPYDRLLLQVSAPLVDRTITYVNLGQRSSTDLGDVELRAKLFVFQDRPALPHHLLALVAGLKLPTAPLVRDGQGQLLPIEAQPGTGSLDPILGLAYGWYRHPWSLYGSATGSTPLHSREGFRASPSLRTTLALQYQLATAVAGRLGIDTRLDGKAQEGGVVSRDSGGFIAFLSPELAVSVSDDLLVFAFARLPIVNALSGFHREGAFFGAGLAYDLF